MLKFDPDGFYTEWSLRVMGLDGEAMRKARKSGELKFKEVGAERLYKGEWLLEWLQPKQEATAK